MKKHIITGEDICVWPDGMWCEVVDLEEFLLCHSDDYVVLPWYSKEAMLITGDHDPNEPCGYCGTSRNPNDICITCWEQLS